MKNKVLVFVSLFILSSTLTFAQEGLNDLYPLAPKYTGNLPAYKLSQTSLKGKIRTIVVKEGEGEERFGKMDFKNYNNATLTIFSFDENGNLQNRSYYGYIGGDRMIQSKEIYSYDSRNRLIRIDSYNSQGARLQSWEYKYNQNNVISSLKVYYGSGGEYQEYEVDKNGIALKIRSYDNYGNLTDVYNSDIKCSYFNNGSLKTITSYSNNQMYESTTLDNQGRIIEVTRFKDGTWTNKQKYTYNAKGFLSTSERVYTVTNGISVTCNNEYDNRGNVIKFYAGNPSDGYELTTFEFDYW